jgi:pilus assembly protein Flp/PilA
MRRMYGRAMERISSLVLRASAQTGATAVEYALMLALIAAVIIAAVAFLGQSTNNGFDSFGSNFNSAAAS